MLPEKEVTQEEWDRIAPLLPELLPRNELRGRPAADPRAVLNGILWVFGSGSSWSAMPSRFPSYQTCHRRFKAWYESGVLHSIVAQLSGVVSKALFQLIEARMRLSGLAKAAKQTCAVSDEQPLVTEDELPRVAPIARKARTANVSCWLSNYVSRWSRGAESTRSFGRHAPVSGLSIARQSSAR